MSKRSRRRRPSKTTPRPVEARQPEPAPLRIDMVPIGADAEGWVHTHGLAALGLPELEIRGVKPSFLMSAAAALLRDIAEYMAHGPRAVRVGDELVLDEHTFVVLARADPLPEAADHYGDDRWCVEELPAPRCRWCEQAGEEPTSDSRRSDPLLN